MRLNKLFHAGVLVSCAACMTTSPQDTELIGSQYKQGGSLNYPPVVPKKLGARALKNSGWFDPGDSFDPSLCMPFSQFQPTEKQKKMGQDHELSPFREWMIIKAVLAIVAQLEYHWENMQYHWINHANSPGEELAYDVDRLKRSNGAPDAVLPLWDLVDTPDRTGDATASSDAVVGYLRLEIGGFIGDSVLRDTDMAKKLVQDDRVALFHERFRRLYWWWPHPLSDGWLLPQAYGFLGSYKDLPNTRQALDRSGLVALAAVRERTNCNRPESDDEEFSRTESWYLVIMGATSYCRTLKPDGLPRVFCICWMGVKPGSGAARRGSYALPTYRATVKLPSSAATSTDPQSKNFSLFDWLKEHGAGRPVAANSAAN